MEYFIKKRQQMGALYKEVVKDSKFSYGKFTNPDYPLHLQQH